MTTTKKSLLAAAPLFLVLFIDSMGLGLLFPILNSVLMEPTSTFLPSTVSLPTRQFLYGAVVGSFMLCWFFGAAILGDLSDTVGRRKALLICLIGAFFGYLLSAIAIIYSSLWLLFLGRIIAGFTAGSQPIAQAAIVDISTPALKARNIGLILLAVSLGFVFGPIFGGFLSDQHLVSWFNFTTPFYFASLISLLNAILLWFFFQETFYKAGKVKIKLTRAVTIFISAFRHKRIWHLSIVMLIFIFGWSNYFTFITMYMLNTYHFTTLQNSLFLAVMGLGFSLGCGYLVEYVSKRYALKNAVIVASYVSAVTVVFTLLFKLQWVAWVMTFFIGTSIAVAYSIIITIFSNQVSEDEQGWIMGVTGSIMALCFGLTATATGAIAHFGTTLPMALAITGLTISSTILIFVKLNNK